MAPRTMSELKELLAERKIDYKANPAWAITEQLAAVMPDAAQAAQLKILRELAQEDKPDVDHVAAFLADDKNAGALAQAKRSYERAVGLVTAYNKANDGARLILEISNGGLELIGKKRAARENANRSYSKLYQLLEKDGIESIIYFKPTRESATEQLQLLSDGQLRYGGTTYSVTALTSDLVKKAGRTTYTVNLWIAGKIKDGDETLSLAEYYDRHVDGEGNIQ